MHSGYQGGINTSQYGGNQAGFNQTTSRSDLQFNNVGVQNPLLTQKI
jgi:hypothetical protein